MRKGKLASFLSLFLGTPSMPSFSDRDTLLKRILPSYTELNHPHILRARLQYEKPSDFIRTCSTCPTTYLDVLP